MGRVCAVASSLAGSPAKIARSVARLFAVVGLVAFGGCAQITVFSDAGPPKEEWKFGVLAIDLAPSAKNTIASVKGFGLVSNPSGMTLGYADARIVRLGNECRLVISMKDAESLEQS